MGERCFTAGSFWPVPADPLGGELVWDSKGKAQNLWDEVPDLSKLKGLCFFFVCVCLSWVEYVSPKAKAELAVVRF